MIRNGMFKVVMLRVLISNNLSSPKDECESGDGPGRVELLTNLSYTEDECESGDVPGKVELLTNLSSP